MYWSLLTILSTYQFAFNFSPLPEFTDNNKHAILSLKCFYVFHSTVLGGKTLTVTTLHVKHGWPSQLYSMKTFQVSEVSANSPWHSIHKRRQAFSTKKSSDHRTLMTKFRTSSIQNSGCLTIKQQQHIRQFWDLHSSVTEDSSFQGCDTALLGKWLPAFWRSIVSSRSRATL